MNRISKDVNNYYRTLSDINGEPLDYSKVRKEIEELTKIAEENLLVMNLINIGKIETEVLDLSYIHGEDYYYSRSGSYYYEGCYYDTEEEFYDAAKEDYLEDIEDGLNIEDILDLDDYFEEDEVYWSYAYKYNGVDVDEDLAKEAGLVVIEVYSSNISSQYCDAGLYLTLGGCGMDMTHTTNYYKGLKFGYIDESFSQSNLDWMMTNLSKNQIKKFLVSLGVKEEIAQKYVDKYMK